jgi:hypothetical protein
MLSSVSIGTVQELLLIDVLACVGEFAVTWLGPGSQMVQHRGHDLDRTHVVECFNSESPFSEVQYLLLNPRYAPKDVFGVQRPYFEQAGHGVPSDSLARQSSMVRSCGAFEVHVPEDRQAFDVERQHVGLRHEAACPVIEMQIKAPAHGLDDSLAIRSVVMAGDVNADINVGVGIDTSIEKTASEKSTLDASIVAEDCQDLLSNCPTNIFALCHARPQFQRSMCLEIE